MTYLSRSRSLVHALVISRLFSFCVAACFLVNGPLHAQQVELLEPDASDAQTYLAVVAITVPDVEAPQTRLLLHRGELMRSLEMPVGVATGTNGQDCLIKRHQARSGESTFYCYIKRGAPLSLAVVRVGSRRFPMDLSGTLTTGRVAQKRRTEYGLLANRRACTTTEWTDATKRRVLEASVRISSPGSVGSGTVVETPAHLKHWFKPHQALVVTAAHVVDDDPIAIEFFNYDSHFRPSVRGSFPAALLVSLEFQTEGDLAYLAVDLGDEQVTKVPLADAQQWYTDTYWHLSVGCPNGGLPQSRYTLAVQAQMKNGFPVVTTSTPSVQGESGGGLFSPDGTLVAVRSATADKSSRMITGLGLLSAPEEGRGERVLRTSVFTHPFLSAETVRERKLRAAQQSFAEAVELLDLEDQRKLEAIYRDGLLRAELLK